MMADASAQFQGERRISPEEEIKELEQKLEAKKRELAGEGKSDALEKEVFREVMREHIEAGVLQAPGAGAPAVSHISTTPAKKVQDAGASDAARDERLRTLVERALTRSIADAIDTAYRESPYLLDALHDRLVDEYYDKLIALRKIDSL